MRLVRLFVLFWLWLCAAACTPVRSSLPPPYFVDGVAYDAEQMDQFANQACKVSSGGTLPPNKFTTDGCSAWPDASWVQCCLKHDVAYWCGAAARKEADQAFRACVRDASSSRNSRVMYTGVRLGGGRLSPFPWRFGYGHPWPHRKPHKL
jgi:hypothetical protein